MRILLLVMLSSNPPKHLSVDQVQATSMDFMDSLVNLRIREIHLWMLLLELIKS